MTAVSNVKELIDSSETYKQDRRPENFIFAIIIGCFATLALWIIV